MKYNKKPLSVFITDNGIAFFGGSINIDNKDLIYGQEALPIKVIENGYIKEPELLLNQLKAMWKKFRIKPKFIRYVVQDQNILVREFNIKKSDLKKKSIGEYFNEQLQKKFHVPFNETIISYQIKTETDEDLSILLYIADEDLLQDYYDVFEKLGVRDIVFDLAISALMEISDTKKQYIDKNLMMVSLYDNQISIQIIEKEKLVFGIIEEYEGKREDCCTQFEIYCERVANYYQYNMRNGNEKIEKTLIFNLNETLEPVDITRNMLPKIEHLNASLFSDIKYESLFKSLSRGLLVTYASNEILLHRDKNKKIIDFSLKRIKRLRFLGYYSFIIALAIFTSISVIYLPYYASRESAIEQQYIIDSLSIAKSRIERNINDNNILVLPSDYIDSYEIINENQALLPLDQFQDLEDALFNNLEIVNFNFSIQEKTIVFTIEGGTTHECLTYILNIYEAYGISDIPDESAWIVSQPIENIISDGVVEVTVYYA